MALLSALLALTLFFAGGATGSVVLVFGSVITAMVAVTTLLSTGRLTRFH